MWTARQPPPTTTRASRRGPLGDRDAGDYSGADEYHAVRLSQGSCTFGVGILADFGNEADVYDAEALCQGGAFAGIAILVDGGGADEYTAWNKSQGFGGVMGIGYLIDQSDNMDIYMAEPSLGAADATRPEYYYDAYESNISNCQGAGWGARWGWLSFGDPAQNEVGSGGLGILVDGGGTTLTPAAPSARAAGSTRARGS